MSSFKQPVSQWNVNCCQLLRKQEWLEMLPKKDRGSAHHTSVLPDAGSSAPYWLSAGAWPCEQGPEISRATPVSGRRSSNT